jgi:integrase
MKITPVLWTYHKSKSNKFPVKIRITHTENNKTKVEYINLGFSVLEEQWNGRVKNHPFAPEYNIKILETLAILEKNYLQDGSVSTGNKYSVNWWFNEYIKICESKHSSYHYRKIKNVFVKLKSFNDNLQAKQIDTKLISDFEIFLLNEGLHINYVADILTRLAYVVNSMVDGGAIEYHRNPFNKYKIKRVNTEKDRLSFRDITLLEMVKLKGDTELARDIYVFSFYAGGVRFGDCCRINKSNFDGNRLKYTMHKTNNQKNVKLPDKVIKMLKKYNFEFPTNVDWKNQDKSIASRGTYLRKKLKEACRIAEIKEVTFHTSRHSIADYAIKKGLTDQQLQGVLGHKRSATTHIYKKSFYQEETDEAMDKLFN